MRTGPLTDAVRRSFAKRRETRAKDDGRSRGGRSPDAAEVTTPEVARSARQAQRNAPESGRS
jgi:hypothetical protein